MGSATSGATTYSGATSSSSSPPCSSSPVGGTCRNSSWSCPCPDPSRSAPTLKQSYARRSNLSPSSSRRTLPHAMKRSRQRNCLQVMTRPPEDRCQGQLYLETNLAMTESLIYKTSYNTLNQSTSDVS